MVPGAQFRFSDEHLHPFNMEVLIPLCSSKTIACEYVHFCEFVNILVVPSRQELAVPQPGTI